jgi:DNA-binding LacI/PurR family transcriptional regulator
MSVRLQDIAKQLNLSLTTVSLALRDSPQIKEETRLRVRQVADAIGYVHRLRPGPQVVLQQITFVNPYATTNYFYSDVLHGAELACRQQGVSLQFLRLDADLSEQELARFGAGHGILLVGSIGEPFVRRIKQSRLPVVLVDNNLPHLGLDRVLIENTGGAYQLTEHLIALGHRRIVVMPAVTAEPSFRERVAGYRLAMEQAGLEPRAFGPVADVGDGRSERAFLAWLTGGGRPDFTAIVALNDEQAVGLIHMLQDHGVRVPDDVSVVGFDDIAVAEVIRPALTTCRVPRDMLGQTGVRFLLHRAANPDAPAQALVHDVSLIERASSGPPAAR